MKSLVGAIARHLPLLADRFRCHFQKVFLRYAYPSIEWADGVTIGRNVVIRSTDGGRIYLEGDLHISSNSEIVAQGGIITIGRGGFIGRGAIIVARCQVSIGSDCQIAEYVTIRDQDHRWRGVQSGKTSGFVTTPIEIGNDVWIGAKATILRGSVIGSHAIVGANAVVKGLIPERAIAVGVPARVVPERATRGE
jgi:acetyltransferase-like isoleucine patch superfamily enzyme